MRNHNYWIKSTVEMKQDYITDDCYINGPEGTTFPEAKHVGEEDIQFSLKKQTPLTMKQGKKKNQTFHILYPTGKKISISKKDLYQTKCFQLKASIKIKDLKSRKIQ